MSPESGTSKNSEISVFLNVLVAAPVNQLYTYVNRTGIPVRPGQIVKIPFGSRTAQGVVWSLEKSSTRTDLKEVIHVYDYLPFSNSVLEFIDKTAEYNLLNRGAVLRMALGDQTLFKDIKREAKHHVISKNSPTEIILTEEQEIVASSISSAIDNDMFSVFCIDGVTGSGKTETYLKACEHAISKGKQCLVMLPEISLTPQMTDRLNRYFSSPPLVWHSSVTPKNRRDTWLKAVNGEAAITVSARSGLFLPFSNLGLIIVDEEHDTSYKQEEGIIYNARDMAILRAKILKIPVVLSSATPSIETVNNCISGKYKRLQLPTRFSQVLMPKIEIVDMRGSRSKNMEYLSDRLISEVEKTIKSGRQSLLYINRRGYASLTVCRRCGLHMQCPNCTSWLVEHKKCRILTCHYCGHQVTRTNICPKCGEESLFAYGAGVERIQQELLDKIPNARSVIVSSDTASTAKKMQQLYEDIMNRNYDIIIGTQIFSKGHHFPDLSLVGIVDADAGLAGIDPRAVERTYQTIKQVSGRAGRVSTQGQVLLQTYNPENPLYKSLENYDFESFFKQEMKARELSKTPPYTKLAAIILSSNNPKGVEGFAKTMVRMAPSANALCLQVLGPAPALMTRLHGRTRWRILLRSARNYNLQGYIRLWLKALRVPSAIRISIDIDPYSFL